MSNSQFQELLNEGKILADDGKLIEAIKIYKVAEIMSKDVDVIYLANLYIRLANIYYKLEDKDKSTYYYEKYLEIQPEGQVSVFSRLAHAYYYIDSNKSIDYHNKGLNLSVNEYDAACKIFAMTKSTFYSQQDLKDEAEYEAEQIRANLYKNITPYNHDEKKKNPDKKLNIAYLSSDCRAHTMMNYILPIWENHDKEKFNFFIFNGSKTEDDVTKQIKNIGFEMIDCSTMDNETIAKTIWEKQIDIVIDLGGYTHLKSFSFLYKPAPIIMSYMGYLNTMGMREVDYILTDRYTIPEEKAYLYTEKPLYMDKGYQRHRHKNLADIEPCPFKTNEYITFGSYNCTSKFNETTFYMWSQILKEVPNAKLFIYRTKMTKRIMHYVKTKLIERGITPDRIILSSRVYTPHYKAYSLSDISLDTYPFSGMSIAIETALMGVPTVTLVGEGMQSRGAGRINHILGLDCFNAATGNEYIDIAVKLANNASELDNLRKSLRDKVINSDIKQNEVEFTRNIEEKFIEAWKNFINNP